MSTAALAHDAFAPRRPPGMGRGLALASGVHVLLVIALAWSVHWKTSEPEGVVAELWSALPQIAAPPVAAPEPRPPPVVVEPKPAPPPPRPEAVAAPPREDAQIAIEKAEAARKAEAAKKKPRPRSARKARARPRRPSGTRRRRAPAPRRRAGRKEEARREGAPGRGQAGGDPRGCNLRRMMNQAGASTSIRRPRALRRKHVWTFGELGRADQGACDRSRTSFVLTGDVPGNPLATVEVRLAPDGTIVGRKLTHGSGSAVWDETVLRAIDKTEKLPQDVDGRVQPSISIDFRPHE